MSPNCFCTSRDSDLLLIVTWSMRKRVECTKKILLQGLYNYWSKMKWFYLLTCVQCIFGLIKHHGSRSAYKMAKQINFKNVRLINLKFLFQRLNFFLLSLQFHARKGCIQSLDHVIVNFHAPCRQTVSQRKEMCQKLKAEIWWFDNKWKRMEDQYRYLFLWFNLRFLFPLGRLRCYVKRLSFWVKPSNVPRVRLRRRSYEHSCIQEPFKIYD